MHSGFTRDGAIAKLPDSLSYEQDGEVAILRLNRPEKANALDDRTVMALGAFLERPPVEAKAIVLAANGKHFSAGLDLADVSGMSTRENIHHSRSWHKAFEAVEFGALPVVAVLHGAVIGGGLELAAATHVRVAEASAYYALPEGQRGIFVGGGGSVRLPRLIGTSRMMEMMLTGRTYGAEEGLALGLSHYLVEEGGGLEMGIALARKIAGNSMLANYAVMHALPRIAEAAPSSGYMFETLMAAITQGDDEAKARKQAFLEKRAAKVTPTTASAKANGDL
jgi:enoyl-CoA hydratase/carnithine racemase